MNIGKLTWRSTTRATFLFDTISLSICPLSSMSVWNSCQLISLLPADPNCCDAKRNRQPIPVSAAVAIRPRSGSPPLPGGTPPPDGFFEDDDLKASLKASLAAEDFASSAVFFVAFASADAPPVSSGIILLNP